MIMAAKTRCLTHNLTQLSSLECLSSELVLTIVLISTSNYRNLSFESELWRFGEDRAFLL